MTAAKAVASSPALIRTFTVGPGIPPDRPLPKQRFAGYTAGRDFHPTPQVFKLYLLAYPLSHATSVLFAMTSSNSPDATL